MMNDRAGTMSYKLMQGLLYGTLRLKGRRSQLGWFCSEMEGGGRLAALNAILVASSQLCRVDSEVSKGAI